MDLFSNNPFSLKLLKKIDPTLKCFLIEFKENPLKTFKNISIKSQNSVLIELSFFMAEDTIILPSDIKNFKNLPLTWHSHLALYQDGLLHINHSQSEVAYSNTLLINGAPLDLELALFLSPMGKNWHKYQLKEFDKILNPSID